jgi:DNA topoisomerase-6 subunit B
VQYMRLMAVITPYAMFDFVFESASKSTDLHMKFSRRIESMPPYPKEIKYHPSSIDLVTLKQLSADSRNKTLVKFLSRDLSCVTKSLAERLATELGLDADMQLSQLSDNEMMRLLQLFREAKFETPDGKCLSPAGEYNLMLGIQKQMAPEFVVTHQEKVEVFEGHPFIVEVGVCLGSGKMVKPGIQVFRFANRIPMLFEAGSDVTTRVAKKMNWGHFKISKTKDKIGVFTSIVSTKIPFKGTSKEYIGEDAKAIFNAIKHGVTVCAGSLAKKIALRRQMQEHADRKRNLEKYIGNVASAVFGVLDAELTHRAPKRARGPADADTMDSEQLQLDELYDKVKSKEVTAGTLEAHLHDHVNTVHMNAETEATGGEARELNDFYICPFGPRRFTHVVEAPAFKCAVMPVPWYTIDAGCRTVDTPMCHCPDLRYVLDLEAPTCIVQCAHRT